MKNNKQNAREIFRKWCFSCGNKDGKKHLFETFYSNDVFVARRVDKGYTFTWSYNNKQNGTRTKKHNKKQS